jgi:ABC-type sugar transport system permease subunit
VRVTTNQNPQAQAESDTDVQIKSRRKRRRKDELIAWTLLAPGLIAFAIFVILPGLGALALSFMDWRLFDNPSFVGLKHIVRLFKDQNMWKSLGVTVWFLILGVIPTTVIGFLLAVIASSPLRGAGGLRVLYFTPMIASSAITAVLWSNLYKPKFGIFAQILSAFGAQAPNWMAAPGITRPALAIVLIWSALPVVIILYIAGIQKVPTDVYAAAALDGANKWQQLWSITWPMVFPTTSVIAVLMFITFLGSPLEYALLMTDGGPLGETQTLGLYAFKMAFERRDMGYASALALWQLALIGIAFLVGRSSAKLLRSIR